MDIRPFDVQMFISKSADNNKNNNDTLKHNEIYQNLSDSFKKTNENENKKAVELNKSEGENIDKNKKQSGQHFNQRNFKKKETKKTKDKKQSIGVFDVSI